MVKGKGGGGGGSRKASGGGGGAAAPDTAFVANSVQSRQKGDPSKLRMTGKAARTVAKAKSLIYPRMQISGGGRPLNTPTSEPSRGAMNARRASRRTNNSATQDFEAVYGRGSLARARASVAARRANLTNRGASQAGRLKPSANAMSRRRADRDLDAVFGRGTAARNRRSEQSPRRDFDAVYGRGAFAAARRRRSQS